MKMRMIILGIIIISMIIFSFEGCSLFGTNKEERIEQFESDLNNDRSNIYTNFHPDDTADYNAIKDTAFWEIHFPTTDSEIPYSVYDIDISDKIINARVVSNNTGSFIDQPIKFKMEKKGLFNWYIEELTLNEVLIVK